MECGDERTALLRWRAALRRELRAVEHSLQLAARAESAVPDAAGSALLEVVARHSLDLITVQRTDGEYVYVSPNASQLFGWDAEEMEGQHPERFIHPEDLERLRAEAPPEPDGARYRFLCPHGGYRWVETRWRVTDDGQYIVAITRDVHREQGLMEELEQRSTQDVLTSLLNRRGMEEALEREMERSRRSGSELAVAYFDVDRFKEINDTQGHDAGDEVLRRVGAVAAARKRGSDYAARWGGDEFLLLLPDATVTQAVHVARRIAAGVAESIPPVTLSFGVATTATASTVRDLLRAADEALYAVKKQGGGAGAVHGRGVLPKRWSSPRA